jgi:hypothetical protein
LIPSPLELLVQMLSSAASTVREEMRLNSLKKKRKKSKVVSGFKWFPHAFLPYAFVLITCADNRWCT